ncbi:hypothetical protein WJX72_007070 [[Myrmecia] bisecta]|uniref:Uncharacterized protein n=1 Tax=[Myrmecia] bisecta TaxID=41462 RepID=A0AAW1QRB8_9CHLO
MAVLASSLPALQHLTLQIDQEHQAALGEASLHALSKCRNLRTLELQMEGLQEASAVFDALLAKPATCLPNMQTVIFRCPWCKRAMRQAAREAARKRPDTLTPVWIQEIVYLVTPL